MSNILESESTQQTQPDQVEPKARIKSQHRHVNVPFAMNQASKQSKLSSQVALDIEGDYDQFYETQNFEDTILTSGVNAMPAEIQSFQRQALQKTKNEMQQKRAESKQITKRPVTLGIERYNFNKSKMRTSEIDGGFLNLESQSRGSSPIR